MDSPKESKETKVCPHCKKEIPKKAALCPQCNTDYRVWFKRHPVITTVLVAIVFSILIAISNPDAVTNPPLNNATASNSDLNATVHSTADGITVTNNESSTWTNCIVGINGGNGWGFDNPPYKTQNPLNIAPGKQLVPYSRITLQDGTTFDPITHAINTVVVVCFQGTRNMRYWSGSSGS